jgi:hypothetical protein
MLPDSNIDEPASNGYVSYTVKCKSTLPENTVVTNLANIYFDMNLPVVTNQTENTMVSMIPTSISEESNQQLINIYPNPFTGSILIETEINNGTLVISDIQGRTVFKSIIHQNSTFNIGFLLPGIYLYSIVNEEKEIIVGRLIKQ